MTALFSPSDLSKDSVLSRFLIGFLGFSAVAFLSALASFWLLRGGADAYVLLPPGRGDSLREGFGSLLAFTAPRLVLLALTYLVGMTVFCREALTILCACRGLSLGCALALTVTGRLLASEHFLRALLLTSALSVGIELALSSLTLLYAEALCRAHGQNGRAFHSIILRYTAAFLVLSGSAIVTGCLAYWFI